MSNDNDSLVDKDGTVYEKGWNGEYHPKEGLFGNERDVNWTGQANAERDWAGNPQEERDWLGRPTQSNNGNTLYRRSSSDNSSSSSSSGGEFILALILIIAALALGAIGIAIVSTPITAPFLLFFAENARKRSDVTNVQKWEKWARIATAIAPIIVLLVTFPIGVNHFLLVSALSEIVNITFFKWIIYAFGFVSGIILFALWFTTGISPTAFIYLRYNGTKHSLTSKLVKTIKLEKLKSVLILTAILTIAFTATSTPILILILDKFTPSPEEIVSGAFEGFLENNTDKVNGAMSSQGLNNARIFCNGSAIACLQRNYSGAGKLSSISVERISETSTFVKIELQTNWSVDGSLCQTYDVYRELWKWRITTFSNPSSCR